MYADYGWNPFKAAKKVVKRTVKVVSQPITGVRKLVHGDIKGASKALLDATNPVANLTQIVSDDRRKLDYARIASPLTVVNIENRDLRKKAAIGYAAVAIVAGTIATAGALGVGASSIAAPGSAAFIGPVMPAAAGGSLIPGGLTAALTTGAGYVKQAKTASDLFGVGKTLLSRDKGGGGSEGEAVVEESYPQERALIDSGGQLRYETAIQHKQTPWLLYGGIGLGVITLTGIAYYLAKSTTKEVA